uniref:autotransporter outer membrane beta-barrel domain-containing protein n=1 Tax=Bartonella clarridgeiae TaxID=56426 RepID=UPI0009DECA6A
MKKAFGIKLSLQNIFLLFSTTFIHSAELIADNGRVTSISEDISIESIINSSIINGGKFESKYIGVLANKIGKIDFTGVDITTGLLGVVPYGGSRVYIKNSTIRVTNPSSYGIYFRHKPTPDDLDPPSQVHLTNTTISSPHIGISSKGSGIVILKNSQIYSDILLTSQPTTNTAYQTHNYAEMLRIDADGSTLQGQSKVNSSQYVFLTLKNGSKWIIPANSNSEETRQESTMHMLHLYDSAIVFDKKVIGGYQTLFIQIPQEGFISQYFAAGDAKIYFNLGRRDSDKLIIKTDVRGVTKVHINHTKDPRDSTDVEHIGIREYVSPSQERISLIEVYGKANENSFKLAHGYTTVDGLPYKNVLKGIPVYNVDKSEPPIVWHFKLQNTYLDPQSRVKALVPRMASYLVMPNALFSSGISDINNQNRVLADMRERLVSSKKKGSLFLSSYGNVVNFSSIRNPLQYGYGADIVYAALQTGVVLGSFENENTITHFGLLGTYGKVSFTPKDMEGSAKSSLDKWSVSAFGGVQHDNNLYMNALL